MSSVGTLVAIVDSPIAKIQGFIIFVKGAKAGDKSVKIKVNSVGDRFAAAEVVAGQTDTT